MRVPGRQRLYRCQDNRTIEVAEFLRYKEVAAVEKLQNIKKIGN